VQAGGQFGPGEAGRAGNVGGGFEDRSWSPPPRRGRPHVAAMAADTAITRSTRARAEASSGRSTGRVATATNRLPSAHGREAPHRQGGAGRRLAAPRDHDGLAAAASVAMSRGTAARSGWRAVAEGVDHRACRREPHRQAATAGDRGQMQVVAGGPQPLRWRSPPAGPCRRDHARWSPRRSMGWDGRGMVRMRKRGRQDRRRRERPRRADGGSHRRSRVPDRDDELIRNVETEEVGCCRATTSSGPPRLAKQHERSHPAPPRCACRSSATSASKRAAGVEDVVDEQHGSAHGHRGEGRASDRGPRAARRGPAGYYWPTPCPDASAPRAGVPGRPPARCSPVSTPTTVSGRPPTSAAHRGLAASRSIPAANAVVVGEEDGA